MRIKGYNGGVILLVFFLTLLIIFGTQHIFTIYSVDRPISRELGLIEEVQEYNIINNGDKTDIEVKIARTPNLFTTYNEIYDISEKALGNQMGTLIVKDQRNDSLEDIVYSIKFHVYQGISTGLYADMENTLSEKLDSFDNIEYNLYMDDKAVYVALYMEDDYLYEVVLRNGPKGNNNGGESLW